jgi:hypothetical protein
MRDLSTAIAETISHLIRHAHLLYPALLPLTPTQSSIAFPNSCNSKCFRCIDSSIPSSIPSDFFAVEVARLFLGSAESLYRCLSTIDDSMRKCSNVIKLAYSSQRKMSLDSASKNQSCAILAELHISPDSGRPATTVWTSCSTSRNPRTSFAINNALDCYFFRRGDVLLCATRRTARAGRA